MSGKSNRQSDKQAGWWMINRAALGESSCWGEVSHLQHTEDIYISQPDDWSVEMINQSQAGITLRAASCTNGSAQCTELHISLSEFCGSLQSWISCLCPPLPVLHHLQEHLILHKFIHVPYIQQQNKIWFQLRDHQSCLKRQCYYKDAQ